MDYTKIIKKGDLYKDSNYGIPPLGDKYDGIYRICNVAFVEHIKTLKSEKSWYVYFYRIDGDRRNIFSSFIELFSEDYVKCQ
jgi:hypothetical protein